jgi:hypothetical protein
LSTGGGGRGCCPKKIFSEKNFEIAAPKNKFAPGPCQPLGGPDQIVYFVCVGVMYLGEYDVCDVIPSVHPLRVTSIRLDHVAQLAEHCTTVAKLTFQLARCGCTLRVTSQKTKLFLIEHACLPYIVTQ